MFLVTYLAQVNGCGARAAGRDRFVTVRRPTPPRRPPGKPARPRTRAPPPPRRGGRGPSSSGIAGSTSSHSASTAPRPCIIPAGRASAHRWKCSEPSPQRAKWQRATPGIALTAALIRCINGPSAASTSGGAVVQQHVVARRQATDERDAHPVPAGAYLPDVVAPDRVLRGPAVRAGRPGRPSPARGCSGTSIGASGAIVTAVERRPGRPRSAPPPSSTSPIGSLRW